MRDEDKPFVCYRGPGFMKISPRNAAGWRAMLVWMAMLVPVLGLFIFALPLAGSDLEVAIVVGGYVAAMIVWAWGGYRWMKARSEIVDLSDLLALKRAQERRRGRKP